MREKNFTLPVIANYTNKARDFLAYITGLGIVPEAVRPDDVESYLHARRQEYRRRHGSGPVSDVDWRSRYTGPLRMLLRLVCGSWPPALPFLESLKARLEHEQLGGETISLYLYHARQFLDYLDRQQIQLERVSLQDLDAFIAQRLRSYRKRYSRSPRRLVEWRCTHTAAIHRLLQDAQGQWPPPSPGDADLQRFESHLVGQGRERKYIGVWRGHARQFLAYLNQRGIGGCRNILPVGARYLQKAESESFDQPAIPSHYYAPCGVRLPAFYAGRMAASREISTVACALW